MCDIGGVCRGGENTAAAVEVEVVEASSGGHTVSRIVHLVVLLELRAVSEVLVAKEDSHADMGENDKEESERGA